MEININDYLDKEEIREICRDEVRKLFKDEQNAQRLLSNLSYNLVYDEIDKVVPNSRQVVIDKTESILNNIQSYSVFRDSEWDRTPSLAYKIMEESVRNNVELINEKVKETIINKDYSEEIWDKYEELAEGFISNIYEIVRLGKSK